jgi:DNA-binding MarR family transcriptional regulator
VVGAAARRPAAAQAAAGSATADGLDAICFSVARAYYNYIALLERVLAGLGLQRQVAPGMGHVLFALFERDDRVIRELVERTRLAYPTLSAILGRMQAGGLVECRRDDADGRAVRVRLTRPGRSLEPACREAVARLNRVMLAGLEAGEVRAARRLLECMTESMRRDAESVRDLRRRNGRSNHGPSAKRRMP